VTASVRLGKLVARCEADPSQVAAVRADGDALAAEVGGDLELRWRIAVVRSVMAVPPDPDSVREIYGELVDRYRDEPDRLAEIKSLGEEIRKLEAEGSLPSTLVVRSAHMEGRGFTPRPGDRRKR
jgi:hypothetical protein